MNNVERAVNGGMALGMILTALFWVMVSHGIIAWPFAALSLFLIVAIPNFPRRSQE